jgi:dihydroxyacetone kinase-like predicted kinase
MLSVIGDAADRAAEHAGGSVTAVLEAAVAEARAALARTTAQLPALRDARVVDAGAKGLVLLLDALLAAVTGGVIDEPVGPLGPLGRVTGDVAPRLEEHPPGEPLEFPYEVQYLLEAPDDAVPPLREQLDALGDSLVIVGGGGLFAVHVHTDRPQEAVAAASGAGRAREVSISDLEAGVIACAGSRAREVQAVEPAACALVVAVDGEGLATAFRSLGATIAAPADAGTSLQDAVAAFASAISGAGAPAVVVVPNGPGLLIAARAASERAAKDARVVETLDAAAGLAAAAAFNPAASVEENVRAMQEAAARCRTVEVASVASPADGAAARAVVSAVRALLAGETAVELVTLVAGREATSDEAQAAARMLRESFPAAEVEVLEGGQASPRYLIGVE